MVKRKFIISFILSFITIISFSQRVILDNDTTYLDSNSAIFYVHNIRGSLQWQISKDTINWINIQGAVNDSLRIWIDSSAVYRLIAKEGTCDPVISDTIYVKKYPTIPQAYPGIKGEIIDFVIGDDTITCSKINDDIIFQGDIILSEQQVKILSGSKGTGLMSLINRWPNKIIYYKIANTNKIAVQKAIEDWAAKTTLQFVDIETLSEYPDNYVEFVDDPNILSGYSSGLGMTGGRQLVYLSSSYPVPRNFLSTVKHEIGHVIGLVHEHSREDRDDSIIVDIDNLINDREIRAQFNKVKGTFYTKDFDFKSLMIYPSVVDYSWTKKDGKPVMTKRRNGDIWEQNIDISPLDIQFIESLYQIPSVQTFPPFDVSDVSVVLSGNVVLEGALTVIEYGFYYSKSTLPERTGTKIPIGSGIGSYSRKITGLSPGTRYYVKAYAINNFGTAYGDQLSFRTEDKLIDSLIDHRDGKEYKTVKIGNQWWMADNLSYLPSVSPPSTGSYYDSYCYVYGYEGNSVIEAKTTTNFQSYGVLYNWPAAINVCPTGWHLPSDEEWAIMENFLIANGYNYDGTTSDNKIAKSLAATTNWQSTTNIGAVGNTDYPEKRNITGFSARPGGFRGSDGTFSNLYLYGYWWSSSYTLYNFGWARTMGFNQSIVDRGRINKLYGFSIRCVRN